MDVGERVGGAGRGDGRGLGHAEAHALVLLGVGQARVHGQHERGVARFGGVIALARCSGMQQRLSRGVPEPLVEEAREAGSLEARLVLLEAVAREHELVPIVARRPPGHARICLAHALGGEGAVRALVVEHVDARVDLAAHGIVRDGEQPALPRQPCAPGDGVEGRGAVEHAAQAAGDSLGRGDADAHARERAGAAAHEHRVDVRHGEACAPERVERRRDELDVRLAPAQMVARGEHAHVGGPALAGGPRGDRACEHVGRGIKREHGIGGLHGDHPFGRGCFSTDSVRRISSNSPTPIVKNILRAI